MAISDLMGSSLIGAGAGLIGSALQYASSKKLMRYQQDLQNYAYQHRYQWQVNDLRAAGLNPMLSVTGGGLSAPVPNSVTNGGPPDISSGLVNAMTTGAKLDIENKRLDNEGKKIALDQMVAESTAEKLRQESERLKQETSLTIERTLTEVVSRGILKDKGEAEINAIRSHMQNEIAQTRALVNMYNAQADSFTSQAALNRAMIPEVAARCKNYLAQAGLHDVQQKQIEFVLSDPQVLQDREFVKNHPWVSSVGSFLNAIGFSGSAVVQGAVGVGMVANGVRANTSYNKAHANTKTSVVIHKSGLKDVLK